jgi:hypothetical protein
MTDEKKSPPGAIASKPDDLDKKAEAISKKFKNVKKPQSGEDTIAWIKDINENLETHVVAGLDDEPYMTMLCAIDTLFDHLQRYTFEFNQSDENTDLVVQCERPNYGAYVHRCYGNLNSGAFGIIVLGEKEKIRAYVVPTVEWPNFDARLNEYTPFMEMSAREESGGLLWQLEGLTIFFVHLPIIAKKVFARLVRVARQQATGKEPFELNLYGAEMAPNADKDEALYMILNRALKQMEHNISNSCSNLLLAIDQELENTKKLSVRVLKENPELMPRLIRRTEALRTYRNMTEILISESPEVFTET